MEHVHDGIGETSVVGNIKQMTMDTQQKVFCPNEYMQDGIGQTTTTGNVKQHHVVTSTGMSDKLVCSEASIKVSSEGVSQQDVVNASAKDKPAKPRPYTKDNRPRASSCPPKTCRSINSGPWSLDWLTQISHEETEVVFSSKLHQVNKKCDLPVRPVGKKKLNGSLKHLVHNLKRVA